MVSVLCPQLYFHVDGPNGEAASSYTVESFIAGTGTQTPTYTDVSGTVENSNPLTLDGFGNASVYLNPTIVYKFVIRYPASLGSGIFKTIDNVDGSSGAGGTSAGVVKISVDDTTNGFAADKIVAGTGIALTVLNDGGNEQLEISAAGIAMNDLQGAYDDGDGTIQESSGKSVAIAAASDYDPGDSVLDLYSDGFSSLSTRFGLEDFSHVDGTRYYYRDLASGFVRDSISTGMYANGPLEVTDVTHSVAYRRADAVLAGHYSEVTDGVYNNTTSLYSDASSSRLRLDADSSYYTSYVTSTQHGFSVDLGTPSEFYDFQATGYNHTRSGLNNGCSFTDSLSASGQAWGWNHYVSASTSYNVTICEAGTYHRYAQISGVQKASEYASAVETSYTGTFGTSEYKSHLYSLAGINIAATNLQTDSTQNIRSTITSGVSMNSYWETSKGYWTVGVADTAASGSISFRDKVVSLTKVDISGSAQSFIYHGLRTTGPIGSDQYTKVLTGSDFIFLNNVGNSLRLTTIASAMTLSLDNPQTGFRYGLLVDNASGGGTITWASNTASGYLWAGGVAPVLAAGTVSAITLYYDGTYFYGTVQETFS